MINNNTLQLQTQPIIINGYNQQLAHQHVTGTLSVKCIFNGRARYTVEGAHLAIDDARYLILNHAQPYDMVIESTQPVESFCVFFPQTWSNDVLRNLTLSDDILLDNPYDSTQPMLFYEIPHFHDALVSPIIHQLRRTYCGDAQPSSEQIHLFYQLLIAIVTKQRGIYQDAEAFPGVRQTTRQELYRRLHLAQAYLVANLHQPISLDDLARIAMMSPYHFLRRFSDVFHMTPHAYLTQQRLNRARDLLITSQLSITAICLTIGFQSLGSFSALFKRTYGVSPRTFRQIHAHQKIAILKKYC